MAEERGLALSQPATLKTDADRAALDSWRPDVLVVVAYGLILPQAVLELPPLGCINIHASLLPRWRGAAPIQRALLAGDLRTGITIMRMDAGLDTGPILLQRPVQVSGTETGGSLHDRLAALGGSALLEALADLAAGRARAVPQPADGVTYAAKIGKAEARIDWNQDAGSIERQIRAFNPWPVAETHLEGEQVRVFSAHAVADATPEPGPRSPSTSQPVAPGTILAAQEDSILVACGHGRLAVTQIQRPGRRVVSARDFANTLPLTGRRLG